MNITENIYIRRRIRNSYNVFVFQKGAAETAEATMFKSSSSIQVGERKPAGNFLITTQSLDSIYIRSDIASFPWRCSTI